MNPCRCCHQPGFVSAAVPCEAACSPFAASRQKITCNSSGTGKALALVCENRRAHYFWLVALPPWWTGAGTCQLIVLKQELWSQDNQPHETGREGEGTTLVNWRKDSGQACKGHVFTIVSLRDQCWGLSTQISLALV